MNHDETNDENTLEALNGRVERLELWFRKVAEMLIMDAETVLYVLRKLHRNGLKASENEDSVGYATRHSQTGEITHFFVEWLINGVHKSSWISEDEMAAMLEKQKFDIVVSEPNHLLEIVGQEPRSILAVRKMQRGMLWLIFTNAGKILEHAEIGSLFGLDVLDPAGRRSLYQYRIELEKLLGKKLRDRMILKGADLAYEIPRKGWSFCWIRLDQNRQKSELIHNVRKGKPSE